MDHLEGGGAGFTRCLWLACRFGDPVANITWFAEEPPSNPQGLYPIGVASLSPHLLVRCRRIAFRFQEGTLETRTKRSQSVKTAWEKIAAAERN